MKIRIKFQKQGTVRFIGHLDVMRYFQKVMRRADFALSFSRMTFPHQLMRVVLLEQIYRSYRIMNHQPYHK